MPKFVKKPIEVEARQWDGSEESQREIVNWANGKVSGWFDGVYFLEVETLHGPTRADIGDWIIRGPSGDYWPCKPHIFEQTYEPIEKSLDEIRAEMVKKVLHRQFEYAGLDLRDPDNQRQFLDALREHGIPIDG